MADRERMTDVSAGTLAEFLLARIAEDEAAARAAVVYPEARVRSQRMMKDPTIWNSKTYPNGIIDQARWDAEYPGPSEIPNAEYWAGQIGDLEGIWEVDLRREAIVHAQRHGPARVLAECESKRRIVGWCAEVIGDFDTGTYERPGSLSHHPAALAVTLAVETLRLLALPYADHPHFRAEWRP